MPELNQEMIRCDLYQPQTPMRTFLLTLWFVLLGLVLVTPSTPAADPVQPKPIDWKPIPVGGLSVSLATSGYRFQQVPVVTRVSANGRILPQPSFKTSFIASVCLSNRSRAAIPFSFNDAGPRWTFRIVDAADQEVWRSNPDVAAIQVITEEVLGVGKSWKTTFPIPLVIESTPLPVGTYTLQAFLNADKSVSATSFFQVVPQSGSDTGINGLVLKEVSAEGGGVEEVPAAGIQIQISRVNLAPGSIRNVWLSTTDSEGKFTVNTPPGRYRITAHRPLNDQAGPIFAFPGFPSASAEVTVQAGAFAEVTLRLKLATPPAITQGIKGTVQMGFFALPISITPGDVVTISVPPIFQYKVRVTQIDTPAGATPFEWSGIAEAGKFQVPTPPGKFNVFGERILAPNVATFVAVPPATDLEVVTVAPDTVATVSLVLNESAFGVNLAE